jgi:hypothetical protein
MNSSVSITSIGRHLFASASFSTSSSLAILSSPSGSFVDDLSLVQHLRACPTFVQNVSTNSFAAKLCSVVEGEGPDATEHTLGLAPSNSVTSIGGHLFASTSFTSSGSLPLESCESLSDIPAAYRAFNNSKPTVVSNIPTPVSFRTELCTFSHLHAPIPPEVETLSTPALSVGRSSCAPTPLFTPVAPAPSTITTATRPENFKRISGVKLSRAETSALYDGDGGLRALGYASSKIGSGVPTASNGKTQIRSVRGRVASACRRLLTRLAW